MDFVVQIVVLLILAAISLIGLIIVLKENGDVLVDAVKDYFRKKKENK